jgi:uncharacterized protein (TIGR03067 family)
MFWCSLLIVLVPQAVGRGAPSDDVAKKETQGFQGSWKAVAIQHADGHQASKDEVQNTRLVIEGNKFTLRGKNIAISGRFSVNPANTPKSIDVLLPSKEGPETEFLGIYQMQGDMRRSCFALPGKERPRQFSPEKGYIGFEWRRD